MTADVQARHADILRRRARIEGIRRCVTAGAERIYRVLAQEQAKLRAECPHLVIVKRDYGPRQAPENVCEACGIWIRDRAAEDAAVRAERLAIEHARRCLEADGRLMPDERSARHAELDERNQRNIEACPHLVVTTSRHRLLGTEFTATCCEACGVWIPESAAKEGGI